MASAAARRALFGAAFVLIGAGLYMAAAAPPEQTQGEAAKLLFVHVPSVVAAYLALGVGLAGAVWYLIRRSPAADLLSASAIEIGVLFCALTLVTGMIWGRRVWGVWWDWTDARMLTTAVLFFFYLAYLALRRSIPDPRVRAGRCAVLGAIGFVQVPIVHYSVLWFRTLHQGPTILRPDPGNAPMDPAFSRPLWVTILAFAATFGALLAARMELARLDEKAADRSRRAAPAGAAVSPPRYTTRKEPEMADSKSQALDAESLREKMDAATATAAEIRAETKDTAGDMLEGVKAARALLTKAEDAARQAEGEYLETLIAVRESGIVSPAEIANAIDQTSQKVLSDYRKAKCDRGQCYTKNCPRQTHDINNPNGNRDG